MTSSGASRALHPGNHTADAAPHGGPELLRIFGRTPYNTRLPPKHAGCVGPSVLPLLQRTIPGHPLALYVA
eukprot:CAMPEP_0114523706 /NCGR_PEP_ID=MMETSP0109-20121206/21437_1 /TAXON_ID=29199 /ORGANISM="Chlorarachnion reptans, Strain CCCM449" /LENGTH=70 /DNA_ID=CAMNT_0001705045 /DNA_START=84 /DNA_END=292 /DNA_ORIENTATION=-